ncbi:MAG: hypothetical protein Hyperionvirus16_50 [Hyperionvirus sp.]|uniref:Uncharacterized protein n=1 Tax=Hyperionvirus sp. TaxID=2487770 RepID=A0A3G5AA11_9VIRU|nr:MAG: hypothetical protein Hyperionvirus16_50 [Hyperionvirus sp.]
MWSSVTVPLLFSLSSRSFNFWSDDPTMRWLSVRLSDSKRVRLTNSVVIAWHCSRDKDVSFVSVEIFCSMVLHVFKSSEIILGNNIG